MKMRDYTCTYRDYFGNKVSKPTYFRYLKELRSLYPSDTVFVLKSRHNRRLAVPPFI